MEERRLLFRLLEADAGLPARWTSAGCEEFNYVDTKSHGEPLDIVKRDISLLPFNGSDIGSMQIGKLGQCLLRQATFCSKRTEASGETRPG